MASDRIQKVEVSDFKGINRSKAGDDMPPNVAQVLKDMRITPDGTLERRQEYDSLYDDRPSQFEHTTQDTASNERLVSDIVPSHVVERSHRRKNTLIGNGGAGALAGEYAFVCYAEKHVTAKQWELELHRGKRSGSDMGSWTNQLVVGGGGDPAYIDATSVQDTNGETDLCWIEASMQFNAAKTIIHFAVTVHDEKASTTKVKHITVTDLYTSDFNGDITIAITDVDGDGWIENSTDITRDVDIELDGDDVQYIFFGKNDTDLKVRTTSSDDFTTVNNYAASLTEDIHGFSLLRDLSDGDNTAMYLTFSLTTAGNVASLRYQKFLGLATSGGVTTVVASGLYIGGGAFSKATGHTYGACCAIDSDGDKNYIYKTAVGTLVHISDSLAASTVSSSLSQIGVLVEAGDFEAGVSYTIVSTGDTDFTAIGAADNNPGTIFIATAEGAGTGTASVNSGGASAITGWDLTVKTAATTNERLITVFLTDSGNTDEIYKNCRTNASGFFGNELLEETGSETFLMFFNTYRTTEVNTAKRFSYLIGAGAGANIEVKYLHSDKGMFDADFDGSVTDAGSWEVQVEALSEPLVNDADGAMSQILILQCSDDKLYKRGNYQWDLLEGQRLVDNSDWDSKAETVFGSNAHIWANHGTVRFGAGNGATNQAMWYDYVDRYFFENETAADDGLQLNYRNHLTRLSRLDPPSHSTMTLTPSAANTSPTLIQNGYETFKGKFEGLDEQDYRLINFLVAFSFEYDGFQESQLLKQTQNSVFILGGRGNLTDLLKLELVATGWNYTSANRLNPRITALNVYMGNPQEILFGQGLDAAGWEEAKEMAQYFKVKRIQISGRKPTGEDAFSNDPLKGTETWTDVGNGIWGLTTYVDYNMWQSALDAVLPVNARNNLGNGLPIYVSTGSGTEVYTKESFVPEGYKYGIAIGNRTYLANMRINGTTRTNRLMVSAFAGSGAVTPDHLSDFGLDVVDLDYDIQGLSRIGDDILVVVGTHGIEAFNVSSGLPRKIEDVVDVGTDVPDSIANIVVGGIGNILRGVLFKDQQDHVRLFDGFSSKVISDPVRDDFITNSIPGIINVTLSISSAQYLYIPSQRIAIFAYGTKIFVLDFRNDSSPSWLYWEFNNSVSAMTMGVDGEMFFTDGNEIFVFPQTGSVDTPNCQWVGGSTRLPEDTRGVLKKVHVDYLSTGAVLQPGAFIDSDATVSNTSSSMAISSTKTRARKSFSWGKRVAREVALELHGTTSTTGLEIHRIVQEIQIEKKKP